MMRCCKAVAAVVLQVAAAIGSPAARGLLAPVEALPVGVLVATVKVDGTPRRLVVDTGAATTVLFGVGGLRQTGAPRSLAPDPSTGLERASSRPAARWWLSGFDTAVRELRPVQIGFESGVQAAATVAVSYEGSYRSWEADGCEGLLGVDVLSSVAEFIISAAGGEIVIGEGQSPGAGAIPARLLRDGRAVIAATDPFGRRRTFLLDTAATGAIYLQKDAAEALRLIGEQRLPVTSRRLAGPNGAVREYRVCTPEHWEFAGVVIERPSVYVLASEQEVEIPQPDIVGFEVLRHFDQHWSFGRRVVQLVPAQPPGAARLAGTAAAMEGSP